MSSSTLSAGPAVEPVTIEELRSHLRVTDSSEDGLLAGYLLAARSLAEQRTGRAFITQTWVETYDDHWPNYRHRRHRMYPTRPPAFNWRDRAILLPRPPLQSVTSVTYIDTNGVQQTLDPSQYIVGKHQGVGFIEEAYGITWPCVRCQVDAIAVTYVVGYGDGAGSIPETARQAILLLVGHFYRNREAVGAPVSALPLGVEALLAPLWVPWGT